MMSAEVAREMAEENKEHLDKITKEEEEFFSELQERAAEAYGEELVATLKGELTVAMSDAVANGGTSVKVKAPMMTPSKKHVAAGSRTFSNFVDHLMDELGYVVEVTRLRVQEIGRNARFVFSMRVTW